MCGINQGMLWIVHADREHWRKNMSMGESYIKEYNREKRDCKKHGKVSSGIKSGQIPVILEEE